MGNQEIEAREIVTAEESKGIMKGKKPKKKKKRILNSDYPVSLNSPPNHACTEQTQRVSFREKYLDKNRTCHLKTEFLVLIRKKKINIFHSLIFVMTKIQPKVI